jgi:hypothetical protein
MPRRGKAIFRMNQTAGVRSNHGGLLTEVLMKRFLTTLFAALFVLGSVNALACGDKAKDEKQMSTPDKTRT